jgi:hypothetical protein
MVEMGCCCLRQPTDIFLQEAQGQETTLLDQSSQMGRALQHLSTDATLSETSRKEQERIIANLQAYAGDLRSAGAALERQHQLTMQQAEAKVQQTLHDASLQFQAVEKRAPETEDSPRRLHSSASDSEKDFLSRWESYEIS